VENLLKKGSQSYYYAHTRALEEGSVTARVYDEPPRLVRKEVVEVKAEEIAVLVTKFSWCDGKKTVSIYIDVENAESLPDDAFVLAHTAKSVTFRFKPAVGAWQVFSVPELSDPIKSVSLKRKANRVTLSLVKESEFSWYELAKKK